ncbi:hypothetical protein ABW38_31100, partial [Achromobacter xylosoxidans]
DDRTKAALTAQGLCTNPSLTTADHRFENPTPNVAQVAPPAQAQYAPSPAPGAQYTASAPVAQAYPVSSAQNIMANSPPLRNPRMDRQGLLDFYSPG